MDADALEEIAAQIASVTNVEIRRIARGIPTAWGISDADREALERYLISRRPVVAALFEGAATERARREA